MKGLAARRSGSLWGYGRYVSEARGSVFSEGGARVLEKYATQHTKIRHLEAAKTPLWPVRFPCVYFVIGVSSLGLPLLYSPEWGSEWPPKCRWRGHEAGRKGMRFEENRNAGWGVREFYNLDSPRPGHIDLGWSSRVVQRGTRGSLDDVTVYYAGGGKRVFRGAAANRILRFAC